MMTISGHNPNQHTILNSKPPKYLERRVDNCVCLLLRPGGREAHLDAEAEDGRLDLCFAQRAIGVIFASHTVGMTVSGALYIGANFDPVSPVLTCGKETHLRSSVCSGRTVPLGEGVVAQLGARRLIRQQRLDGLCFETSNALKARSISRSEGQGMFLQCASK